jgi:DNA-binding transcriptional regulator/RsmH inhibitor MraZ
MPDRISPPDGLGEAPCDNKWRVRLPTPYAVYFQSFEPGKETASIYAASFDGQDIFLFSKSEFRLWRDRLRRITGADRPDARQMLLASQYYGGETEVDRQGRFIVPRMVRKALHLEKPPESFNVLNDGLVRLVRSDRLDFAERDEAPQSSALSGKVLDHYAYLTASENADPAGGSE